MRKNKNIYLTAAMLSAALGLIIALFAGQYPIIRGFISDILIFIFIYSAVKIFFNISPLKLGASVLLFACLVEIMQYFSLINLIGLDNYKMAAIVLGNTFDLFDLLAYAIGFIAVYAAETKILSKK